MKQSKSDKSDLIEQSEMEWQDTRSEWTIDEGGEEDEGEYRRKKRRLYTEEYDYADKNCYSSSSEEEEEEEREENDDISLSVRG